MSKKAGKTSQAGKCNTRQFFEKIAVDLFEFTIFSHKILLLSDYL